jgi:hypothetical protein
MLQHMVAHGGRTEPPLFRAILMNSPFLPFQYPFNDPIPEVRKNDSAGGQFSQARSINYSPDTIFGGCVTG